MILNGEEIPDRDPRGHRIRGASLMMLLHAGDDPIEWMRAQRMGRPVVGVRRYRGA